MSIVSSSFTTVLQAAESLSDAERRELIELLVMGLDDSEDGEDEGPPPKLSEAWLQEIQRRSAEYDAGLTKTVSWEEVRARLFPRSEVDG